MDRYSRKTYAPEFLYCSKEEFTEKINRLNKRPYLREKMGEMSIEKWKKLLNLSDAEYDKYIATMQERARRGYGIEEFRQKIVEMPECIDDPEGSKRFSASEANFLVDLYEENPEAISRLVELRNENEWIITDSRTFADALQMAKNNPEFFETLLKDLNLSSDSNLSKTIASYFNAEANDKELLTILYNRRDPDGSLTVRGNSVKNFEKCKNTDPELFNILLNSKDEEGNYVCSQGELLNIFDLYKNDPETVKNYFNISRGSISKSSIYDLFELIKFAEQKAFTIEILNMVSANGNSL